ncbi:MAG: hypothetical protein M3Z84_06805 [Actinomycetota bacterium]|nr:hypothetical protein [Actinomycetota bacterium]
MTEQVEPSRVRGRPTALTSEVEGRIVHAVCSGVTLKEAAAYAGVTDRTLLNWMRRGEEAAEDRETAADHGVDRVADESDQEFVRLFRAVSAARAEVYVEAVATVRLAVRGSPVLNDAGEVVEWQRFPDWRAAAWFLEHGDPTQWGRVTRTVLDQAAQAAEEAPTRDEELDAQVESLNELVDELVAQRRRRLGAAADTS